MSGAVVGRRVGPYQLQTVVGAGGMGEVWKALDTRLGRTVAIKFSHTEFRSASHVKRMRSRH